MIQNLLKRCEHEKTEYVSFFFSLCSFFCISFFSFFSFFSLQFSHADDTVDEQQNIFLVQEGIVDGKVFLSDGATFVGKGTFENGVLTITSGKLQGLTLENAQYAAGVLVIQKGTVNGIFVEGVNGVKKEGNGFIGTTNIPLANVDGYTIERSGAKFTYADGKIIVEKAGLVSFDLGNAKMQIIGEDVTQIDLSDHTIHSRNTVHVQKENNEYSFIGNGNIFSVKNQD